MKKLMLIVCCFSLLSGCASDMSAKCQMLKKSTEPDAAIIRQAAKDNDLDSVDFELGRVLENIKAQIIFCDDVD